MMRRGVWADDEERGGSAGLVRRTTGKETWRVMAPRGRPAARPLMAHEPTGDDRQRADEAKVGGMVGRALCAGQSRRCGWFHVERSRPRRASPASMRDNASQGGRDRQAATGEVLVVPRRKNPDGAMIRFSRKRPAVSGDGLSLEILRFMRETLKLDVFAPPPCGAGRSACGREGTHSRKSSLS